jgi:RNA polymerase sigma factor (sigma-70 family)
MASLYSVIGPALRKSVSDLIETPDKQLIQSYLLNEDERAFNALFAKYLGLIIATAKSFYGKQKGKSFEYLVDIACKEFFKAVLDHDLDRGGRFINYALQRIRWKFIGAQRLEMNKKFSRDRWQAYQSLRNAINNLLYHILDNTNEITDVESLATELWGYAESIKIDKVNNLIGDIFVALKEGIGSATALKLNMFLSQIDSAVDQARYLTREVPLDTNMIDNTVDSEPSALVEYLKKETDRAIRLEILNLPRQQSLVLILRNILEIKGKEVAEIMCVSEERVSQIKGDGLIRLGIRLRNKGIVER